MPKRGRPSIYGGARTVFTGFRCPQDLLTLATIRAEEGSRSLSNYLIALIAKDVEGMELPPVESKPVK